MIPSFRLTAVALALSLAPVCVGAAAAPAPSRVELPGGEVLMGAVATEPGGEWLTVDSPVLGRLRVPAAGVRITPPPPAAPDSAAATAAAAAPAALAAPAPKPGPVVAEPASDVKWSRLVEGGYNYQRTGNQVRTHGTFVRAEIGRTTPTGSNVLEGRYYYGRQNAQRNTDRLAASLKTRETVRKRLELRNDLSYGYDYLKRLSHQFEDVAGLTFVVVERPRFRYAAGPGVGVQYAEPALGRSGYKFVGDVSQELRWTLAEKINLTHRGSYLYKPEDLQDYRLRSETALAAEVAEGVTIGVRHEYEFEAIRPVLGGRADHRVFTTLGYRF